jgi:putative hydrolase of the HAD superfamily
MAPQPTHRPRAVLLDAMGTLLTFEPPAPHLRSALSERLGVDVGLEPARRAILAEISFYRAHLHEGSDAAGLAALRRASAEAMRPELPPPAGEADGELLTAALLDSLRFAAYPEVPAVLRALRASGIALVVVSNWDVSLHERLADTGLDALVDGAVASAEVGVAKPDPAIFGHALAIAGVGPEAAWHVGDSVEADVAGALAAGLVPVLVARDGAPPPSGAPVRTVAALDGLPGLWS